jgi:hypothetical protein
LIEISGRHYVARNGYDAGGHLGGGRIEGKRMNKDGAGGYACTVPDLDISQDRGARPDKHTAAHLRMTVHQGNRECNAQA